MKKFAICGLAAAMMLSLAACGGEDKNTEPTVPESTVESIPESTVESSVPETTPDTGTIPEEPVVSEEMQAIKDAVAEALGEEYWPNAQIPAEMISGTYGLNEEMYEDIFAEMPMISTNVDTLIVVKAKEDQVTAVEDALKAYRETLVADTLQYPMNIGKIQASSVETIGNYVCFIQLGGSAVDAADQGEEAVIEKCQEANKKAVDAISSVVVK